MKRLIAAITIAFASLLPAVQASAATAPVTPAQFEGRTIDLADGWGDAKACTVTVTGATYCYRTEAGMDRAEALRGRLSRPEGFVSARANCSSPVRLYSSANFGGSALSLYPRQQFLNLANYGFDNITSSFTVGACGSALYPTYPGGGTQFPGSGAWSSSANMQPNPFQSWDNIISSVYIF